MLRRAIAARHTDLCCFFFPGHTEFADPRHLTSFQLHVPLPPSHLEYECRCWSILYPEDHCQVAALFVSSSFQLAAHVILLVL